MDQRVTQNEMWRRFLCPHRVARVVLQYGKIHNLYLFTDDVQERGVWSLYNEERCLDEDSSTETTVWSSLVDTQPHASPTLMGTTTIKQSVLSDAWNAGAGCINVSQQYILTAQPQKSTKNTLSWHLDDGDIYNRNVSSSHR
jgi:hypothetical protein